jgi:fused signal recognition particle receptor
MITLFGNNEPPPSLLDRLKKSVGKTRSEIAARVEGMFAGDRRLDPEQLRRLENALLAADLGVRTTKEMLEAVRQSADQEPLHDAGQLRDALKKQLLGILGAVPAKSNGAPADPRPRVVFVVGVNGTGKTTTIGKLANRFKQEQRSVLLCASDTFRAAAIEQLEIWGQRTDTQVIRQSAGSDPSAVLFDAVSAAKARKVDYVIVDTAGRLQTKENLMLELQKMSRTARKVIPDAPHEVLLVLDATTGQNGLEQARKFTESSGVTGIVLTKLDGTAKGGIVVAIARELNLPIRYIGVGEKIEDLLPFDSEKFIESLFEK